MIRRLLALSFSIVVSSMLVASPVAAVERNQASLASTGCSDSHGSARSAPTGRDGMVREPVLDQAFTDLPARAKGKAGAGFGATIEVYFHVVTDGALGNLTNKQIRDQMAVLNTTFGGGEGGADTGFTFVLAGVTHTDNAKWFAVKTGAEHDMKKTLKQGDDSDLNVYSTTAAAYLGWAYYPSITDTNQSYLDGIVLDWESIPGVSDRYAGRYDLGETLTHEAGHWLNLAHTFDGGCNEPGDYVEDTPAEATPTSGCPEGKDTCTAPGLDPIHNYMDYSFDSCYTQFTPGQAQRMRDAWLFYRAS